LSTKSLFRAKRKFFWLTKTYSGFQIRATSEAEGARVSQGGQNAVTSKVENESNSALAHARASASVA